MKNAGPGHPITVSRSLQRVRVLSGDRLIASSDNALVLKEASYPPVYYVPRCDADMSALSKTERRTHCPYKGDASYFTVVCGEERLADAVWSYESPLAAVAAIAGHLAFYPDRVRIEVE